MVTFCEEIHNIPNRIKRTVCNLYEQKVIISIFTNCRFTNFEKDLMGFYFHEGPTIHQFVAKILIFF